MYLIKCRKYHDIKNSDEDFKKSISFCPNVCYTKRYRQIITLRLFSGGIMDLTFTEMKNLIKSQKQPDKQFYLDLLDEEKQFAYEDMRVKAVMALLKAEYINPLKLKIKSARDEVASIKEEQDFSAANYQKVISLNARIREQKEQIEGFKSFFIEPYFARMDVYDSEEGYNSYYIGKRGDVNLEIVDWRAPLARKYYQKSQINFTINEYAYKLILRRALRTSNGKLIDLKNEYLSLRDYLTKEEIAGRDEEIIFDPFLKEILKTRKEQSEISDIIETIQEKQYDIITKAERDSFILQGCAGSGKTMIMLHRLSYLMYNNEKLKPRDVLVITPSDSFNDFIDELSTVLELEKVKTKTIDDYFINLLQNAGIDIADKIDFNASLPVGYLEYIYSNQFMQDVESRLKKMYDGIAGMFMSEECLSVIESVAENCREQDDIFTYIKNSSLRVRRAVLGEIKEKPEGGLYYTKPFRELMNCVTAVEEFLRIDLKNKKISNYSYFYNRLLTFYRSAHILYRSADKVIDGALRDLSALKDLVEKEISDLRRYKIYKNGTEVETYADRIARRTELLTEISKTESRVREIGERFGCVCELFETLKGNAAFVSIGKCETTLDLARMLYKDIVKKAKKKFGIGKGMFKSDAYLLCLVLAMLGKQLEPHFGLVFIDEGQDISANEYKLLKMVNSEAAFNVYGDLAQNITAYRGLKSWKEIFVNDIYELNQNYRNTNQIVDYVAENLGLNMQPIGFDGLPVTKIGIRGVNGYFKDKKGLKAVIVSEYTAERLCRKSYNSIAETGRISKSKINFMTVYESKGLEFTSVAVADEGMTINEKYIAFTRALKELAVIELKE